MIIEELERKFLDFKETGFPSYTNRECKIKEAPLMVSTIIGARRAGKSIRTFQLADETINSGKIPGKNHICYLDFDNPILARMQAHELKLIHLHFLKLNPGFTLKTPIIFIFDEIHKISGWEEYVIELSRNPLWKVYVTGSSSKMLHGEMSTALRGKSLSTIIYPFNFREFVSHKGIKYLQLSTINVAIIKRFFEEYLKWGSFPAIGNLSDSIKESVLREYFDTMILRDIIERYNISKPQQCIYLLRYILSNIARPYTLNSGYLALKNAKFSTSEDSIRNYIDWAADSFLCFSVPFFSDSISKQTRNHLKIYCIDWALANVNNWVWDGMLTRSLENLIFIHLKQLGYQVNYYLTKEKRQEIDFIVTDTKGTIVKLIQVCYSIQNEDTCKRETEPLVKTMKYFNIKKSYIITLNDENTWDYDSGQIVVLPAWKWLLFEDF